MNGRKPKSTRQRKLEGNKGKIGLNHQEPIFPPADPSPPAELAEDSIALEEWNRIAPALIECGVMQMTDRAALAGYCILYSKWLTAEKKSRDTGMVLMNPNTRVFYRNPYTIMANECLREMRLFAESFGFTPGSRSRVKSLVLDNGQGQEITVTLDWDQIAFGKAAKDRMDERDPIEAEIKRAALPAPEADNAGEDVHTD